MRNKLPLLCVVFAAVIIFTQSCEKTASPVASTDYSFTEEFDTVSTAVAKGWVLSNNSKPIGTYGWIQGFYYVSLYHGYDTKAGGPVNYPTNGGFGGNNPSQSGSDFIMTTADCGHGTATLSNWLISPAVTMKNGDQISFYTRTYANPAVAADRLEVRLNTLNSSADVGRDSNSVGGFTTVLLDINPDYLTEDEGSYPGEWTKYTATITGLPIAKKSRVAFRYYVPNGGPLGDNSQGVGIDKFEFSSAY